MRRDAMVEGRLVELYDTPPFHIIYSKTTVIAISFYSDDSLIAIFFRVRLIPYINNDATIYRYYSPNIIINKLTCSFEF
jgi:hypothetical protein